MSQFNDVPEELIVMILRSLPLRDLRSVSQTSKQLVRISLPMMYECVGPVRLNKVDDNQLEHNYQMKNFVYTQELLLHSSHEHDGVSDSSWPIDRIDRLLQPNQLLSVGFTHHRGLTTEEYFDFSALIWKMSGSLEVVTIPSFAPVRNIIPMTVWAPVPVILELSLGEKMLTIFLRRGGDLRTTQDLIRHDQWVLASMSVFGPRLIDIESTRHFINQLGLTDPLPISRLSFSQVYPEDIELLIDPDRIQDLELLDITGIGPIVMLLEYLTDQKLGITRLICNNTTRSEPGEADINRPTPELIAQFVRSCAHLEELCVHQDSFYEHCWFFLLRKELPHLRSLSLRFQQMDLSQEAMQHVITEFPNLEAIGFQCSQVGEAIISGKMGDQFKNDMVQYLMPFKQTNKLKHIAIFATLYSGVAKPGPGSVSERCMTVADVIVQVFAKNLGIELSTITIALRNLSYRVNQKIPKAHHFRLGHYWTKRGRNGMKMPVKVCRLTRIEEPSLDEYHVFLTLGTGTESVYQDWEDVAFAHINVSDNTVKRWDREDREARAASTGGLRETLF